MTMKSWLALTACLTLAACGQPVPRGNAEAISTAPQPTQRALEQSPTAWPAEPVTIGKQSAHTTATFVTATGKYPLRRRLQRQEPDAAGNPVITNAGEMVGDHLIVTVRPGITPAEVGAMATRVGAAIRATLGGSRAYLVTFPLTDARAYERMQILLSQQPEIATTEPDWIISVNSIPEDPRFVEQWALDNSDDNDVDAPEAWELGTGSTGVRVAVIDTGIDYQHPDLAPNIWQNPGETGMDASGRDKRSNGIDDDGNGFIDDWHGWDFRNDDNDPMDDAGHGTHCAGIIGAAAGNHLGISGIAPQVSLIGIKFLGADGTGTTSDSINAVYYASLMQVPILSNSWGSYFFSEALFDAVSETTRKGLLFVAAAGNHGIPFIDYPGAYPNTNLLCVGSSNSLDQRSVFSNYHSRLVDLLAPGEEILSTVPGESYRLESGTSMATPLVAGAAALLLARYPQATCDELIERLRYGVDKKPAFRDVCLSGGRLNVRQALDFPGLPAALDLPESIAIRNLGQGTWMLRETGFTGHPKAMYSRVSNEEPKAILELSGVSGKELRFRWKIQELSRSPDEPSSEAKLTLQIDGRNSGYSITNTVDWQEVVVPLPPRCNRISWIHEKKGVFTESEAWVDAIRIIPRNSAQPRMTVSLNAQDRTSGQATEVHIPAGSIGVVTIGLRNTGSAPLVVQPPEQPPIDGFAGVLTAPRAGTDLVIRPGDSAEIPIRLWPLAPSWSLRLILRTNDPDQRLFTIPINGTSTGLIDLAEALDISGNPLISKLQGSGWVGQATVTSDGVDAAVTDMLAAGERRDLSMRVLMPCAITYRRKLSGCGNGDSLQMSYERHLLSDSDLVTISTLTTDQDWETVTYRREGEKGWLDIRWSLVSGKISAGTPTVRACIDQIEVVSLAESLSVARGSANIASGGADQLPELTIGEAQECIYRLTNSAPVALTLNAPQAVVISELQGVELRRATADAISVPPGGSIDVPFLVKATDANWSARLTFQPDFSAQRFSFSLSGTAEPQIPLAEALDLGVTGPQLQGDSAWFGQTKITFDGTDAAAIAPNAADAPSNLDATVTGAGKLSFSWRMLDGADDRLTVTITDADGPIVRALTTADAWQTETITLAPGEHAITWSFTAGSGGGAGARAWLDAVAFVRDSSGPAVRQMTLRLVGTVSPEVIAVQAGTQTATLIDGTYDLSVPATLPRGTSSVEVPVIFQLRDGGQRSSTIQARVIPTPAAAN